MKKKFLCLILALAMLLSLVACGGNNNDTPSTPDPAPTTEPDTNTPAEPEDNGELVPYTYDDDEVYEAALGEFYTYYQEALEAPTVAERYAKMAVAEAKMLSAGVMIPLNTNGGTYVLRRTLPKTITTTMWGNDDDRMHNLITLETTMDNVVKVEDWNAMKDLWTELRGTGTYRDAAIAYATEHGYTIGDTMETSYTSDPVSWDILTTQRQAESQIIVQTLEGLVEYDCENVMQPALAESWEINDDFTEFTFHIRQGVNWVDSQGRVVDTVKADDWVAGYQHMLDGNGESALTTNMVKNAMGYVTGEIADFSQVGVEAVDEYTLKYTLETSVPYFDTLLTYSSVASPMSRSYYESHGGKFGINEYDASAADYTYATSSDNIAYCGPFLVTNHTEKNIMTFQANPSYWNADNQILKTINYRYNDQTDSTKAYQDFKAGTINNVTLNSSVVEMAKADGLYDGYNTISDTDATSFVGFVNLNRQSFANANDETKMVSTQTEEQAARTHVAINNVNFRLALCLALDHASYNAQTAGEELKLVSLRNSYTPGNFAYLPEDATIDINGTATTFASGTAYGEIMQAQLDADGIPVKVWDPASGTSDGFDGWYNPTAAKEYLDKAVEELAEANCDISAENPIYIDLPTNETSEIYLNRGNAFAQSVAAATDGRIIVNILGGDSDAWYQAGYYTENGTQSNYDVYDFSGWGPDYGDPSTYLDTLLPDGNGYMSRCIGVY